VFELITKKISDLCKVLYQSLPTPRDLVFIIILIIYNLFMT